MTSSSTGEPSGRLATPMTRREETVSSPRTSRSNSDAASAIFGCSVNSGVAATDTPSRTTRLTRRVDAVHARERVEDDPPPLRGQFIDALPDGHGAELHLRPGFWPEGGGVADVIRRLGQLHHHAKLCRPPAQPLR